MKSALLCFALLSFLSAVSGKSNYFSDLSEEEYKKLQEFAGYLRKQVSGGDENWGLNIKSDPNDERDPAFEYMLSHQNPTNEDNAFFAVGPSDPRFYRDFAKTEYVSETVTPKGYKEKEDETQRKAQTLSFGDNGNPSRSAAGQIPITRTFDERSSNDVLFTAIVAGTSAAAVVIVIIAGIGCYRLQKNAKAAAEVDYPAYGVTGPNKDISPTSGDRRLAQSAQMYHYQHQKQQILAMESVNNKDRRCSISDAESEDENEEGDYTVYECPGLAPTGEMEVKNPLFQDDQTPGKVNKCEAEPNDHPSEPIK